MNSTVHIRRRDLTMNLVGWGVGFVVMLGGVWVVVALSTEVTWSTWFGLGIFPVAVAAFGYRGWRRGEFSPTVVTVDSGGVGVAARPTSTSWALTWEQMSVSLVRDGLDVPYVLFEPVDGLEHGVRSAEERRLAMLLRLPVHVRSLRLTDELRAAITPHLPAGLPAYRS